MFASPERRFYRGVLSTQGVSTSLALALVLVVAGCLVDGQVVAVPGAHFTVPAVRVFPALLAAVGAILLRVEWRPYELVGARSPVLIRLTRLAMGVLIAGVSAGLLAHLVTVPLVGFTLTLFVAVMLAIGVLGELWWVVVPALLYLQIFRSDLSDLQPPWWVVVGIAVVGSVLYLYRNLLPE